MKNINHLYPYLFALFTASLPFSSIIPILPNITLIIVTIAFAFVVKKSDFYKLNIKSFYLLSAFAIFLILTIIINKRWEDGNFITRMVSMLLICVLAIPIKKYKLVLKAFVLSCFFIMILSLLIIGNYIIMNGAFEFTGGTNINKLLLGERPYMGFIYLVASYISWFIGKRSNKKVLWYGLSILFIIFVLTISARMATVSLILMLLALIFYNKKSIKFILVVLTSVILLVVGLFTFNDNLKKRFFVGAANNEFVGAEKLVFEPRYHIWECALGLENTPASIFVGKGFKQTDRELTNCFRERDKFHSEDQKQWFIESKFNTHNQYLGLFFGAGAIALLLFLDYLVVSFLQYKQNYFAISLLVFLTLFLLTENLMNRQLGIMLIGLVTVFIHFIYLESHNKYLK